MVSRSCLLLRQLLGRWQMGLLLLMATGTGWACADPEAAAGLRIGRWAERPALAQAPVRVAHHEVAHAAVVQGLAAPCTAPAGHPCNHIHAAAGAVSHSEPCASPDLPCAGLCAALCLPAAGAGPALPFTPARLAATGRAEACPQRCGWSGTGRSVPPESPPPIV